MWSIFKTFLIQGCISFGGPAAHLGYFRKIFVERLGWLDDKLYAQLIALCQFLPGPVSSQVGFAIGYHRLGIPGGIAAFLGFTLPSFIIMLLLAMSSDVLVYNNYFSELIHVFKLLAVVVVVDAVYGMYKSFCKSYISILICFGTSITLFVIGGIYIQIIVLILSALIGALLIHDKQGSVKFDIQIKHISLLIFSLILIITLAFQNDNPIFTLFSKFYQVGSLVLGGGHVMLPLLQGILEGQISNDTFLLGYAGAQAVPGPMFSLSAFLGYELAITNKIVAALASTIGIFLPGFLILIGFKNAWQGLLLRPQIAGAAYAINAAVVGLILSALYDPVITTSVHSVYDFILVLIGFYLLQKLKIPYLVLIYSLMCITISYFNI